jgi:hypothetical protein
MSLTFVPASKLTLKGHDGDGAIIIKYNIPDGVQSQGHPEPGKPFTGCTWSCVLPDDAKGNEVALLLTCAFKRRVVFTVGDSTTTGKSAQTTWNGIHHKVCRLSSSLPLFLSSSLSLCLPYSTNQPTTIRRPRPVTTVRRLSLPPPLRLP